MVGDDAMAVGGEPAAPAWEEGWEVGLGVRRLEDLLTALLVRDLVHGASFDLESAEGAAVMAVDYLAGDEEEDGTYRLLVTAQVRGPEDRAALQGLTEDLLEQALAEAESLAGQRQSLGSRPLAEVRFTIVPAAQERWDLVVPDWLAPDGAEVPFGFRPVLAGSGLPWPTDGELDQHGRVVAVPHGGALHLFGVPAPAESDDARRLPVHPAG